MTAVVGTRGDRLDDTLCAHGEGRVNALDAVTRRVRASTIRKATKRCTTARRERVRWPSLRVRTRCAPEVYRPRQRVRLETRPTAPSLSDHFLSSIASQTPLAREEASRASEEATRVAKGQLVVYGIDSIMRRFGMDRRPRLLLEQAAADPDDLDGTAMGASVRWLDGPLRGERTTLRKSIKEIMGIECNAYLQLCTNASGKERKLDTQRLKRGGAGFAHLIGLTSGE